MSPYPHLKIKTTVADWVSFDHTALPSPSCLLATFLRDLRNLLGTGNWLLGRLSPLYVLDVWTTCRLLVRGRESTWTAKTGRLVTTGDGTL